MPYYPGSRGALDMKGERLQCSLKLYFFKDFWSSNWTLRIEQLFGYGFNKKIVNLF
ncbi:hypothetical protein ES705_26284 [subsurface metagenome]